jgi:hypothetical protein
MHRRARQRNGVCAPAPRPASRGGLRPGPPIPLRRWPLVLGLALAGGAATWTPGPADDAPAGAILFIGNSLTYAIDLPHMVRRVARAAGGDLRVDLATGPNMAVIDHTPGDSEALRKVRSGRWDAVVLQQGPTPSGICRDTLVIATMRLAPAIARAGGRPALFLPWTRRSYTGPIDDVAESATRAARAVGGIVIPVGIAWRKALEADPTLPLYAGDGYHPAPAGTLLSALTTYDRLVGGDVTAIAPGALAPIAGLTASQARTIAAAAHAASREWPADPTEPAPADTTHRSPGAGPC